MWAAIFAGGSPALRASLSSLSAMDSGRVILRRLVRLGGGSGVAVGVGFVGVMSLLTANPADRPRSLVPEEGPARARAYRLYVLLERSERRRSRIERSGPSGSSGEGMTGRSVAVKRGGGGGIWSVARVGRCERAGPQRALLYALRLPGVLLYSSKSSIRCAARVGVTNSSWRWTSPLACSAARAS